MAAWAVLNAGGNPWTVFREAVSVAMVISCGAVAGSLGTGSGERQVLLRSGGTKLVGETAR
ncbi:MAG: hypothetical protein ABI645_10700 [Pseudomonadota bacterium]